MGKQKEDKEYQSVLEECSSLITRAGQSRWDLIKHNFLLGERVSVLQRDAKYGDGVVEKLAKDISHLQKKQIFPSRLYECATVFRHFGTIDKIETLENTCANEISWHFLVQSVEMEEQKKEIDEKSKTSDPEYIAHIHAINNAIGKLRRWTKRTELSEETRREILAALNDVDADVIALLKAVAEAPTTAQQNMFGAPLPADFALKEDEA